MPSNTSSFSDKLVFEPKHYHPDYKVRAAKMQYWQNIFNGGDSAKGYLKKFAKESSDSYTNRQAITAFPKLSSRVLSVYSTQLFAKDPVRELPPTLEPFVEDIDGDGTNIDAMLSQQYGSLTLPLGLSYFLVTKTAAKDVPLSTLSQEREQDLRPLVVPFSPLALLKWDFDANGKLKYVVLYDSRNTSQSWYEEHEQHELLRVWLPTEYAVYRREMVKDRDTTGIEYPWTLDSFGPHGLGEVPLVAMYNIRVERFKGQTEMDDLGLADMNVDIYNKRSWLDQGLEYQGFPIPVIKTSMDKTELGDIIHSPGHALKLRPGDEYDIHETTGAALTLLHDVIVGLTSMFLDMGFRQISLDKPSASKEAAETKRLDMGQFISALKAKAEQIQETERSIWRLMARWMNQSPDSAARIAEKSVVRTAEIDEEKVKATLAELKDLCVFELLSKRSTLEQAQAQGYLTPDFDIDKEMGVLEDEAVARAENMTKNAPNFGAENVDQTDEKVDEG